MKWIIILATVLSCTTQFAAADQDMPLGDSRPASILQSSNALESAPSSGDSEAVPTSARSRSKPKATTMPKGKDYQPAQDLLLSAMSLIGVKYTWGGSTPEAGLDCSGFIKYVFQNSMNITLPRTALGMSQTGQNVDKTELKPGDLVFFNTLGRTFSHVGIYLGDNRFIHSPRKGRNIEVADMNLSYWQNRFNGARRIADGGNAGLNVNSLLASSNRTTQTNTTNNRETPQARDEQSCKKVITGKGKNKKTTTQCTTAKSSTSKSSGKVSKNSTRSTAAKSNKASSKKTSTQNSKPSSKSTASNKKISARKTSK